MPDSSQEVLQRLVSSGVSHNKFRVPFGDSLEVGAYTFGLNTNPTLLLIHGSPGDWSAWENIIGNDTVNQNYFIVAIDRAGYGITTVPAQAKLTEQAAVVSVLVDSLRLKKIVVAGHSYGGAVAEQLLVDKPELYKLAILVAPTVSPEHMAPRWYNNFAGWPFFNKLLSEDLRSSNLEMVGLPGALKQLASKVERVSARIIYVQGTNDVLVPLESVEYFKSIKSSGVEYIILENKNHFLPWTDPDLINEILINEIAVYEN